MLFTTDSTATTLLITNLDLQVLQILVENINAHESFQNPAAWTISSRDLLGPVLSVGLRSGTSRKAWPRGGVSFLGSSGAWQVLTAGLTTYPKAPM